jgi:hypothetical protein
VAFLSGEAVLLSPRLPYHADFRYSPRDDRIPDYTRSVAEADSTAYVTARQPWLDEFLRAELARRGETWHEKRIGDYVVFFGFGRPVHPADLGLGLPHPRGPGN